MKHTQQSTSEPAPLASPPGLPSHLGALVGRVRSGVGKYQPGIFTQFHWVFISVGPQSSFHRAEIHRRVDDVVVVLDMQT